MPQNVSRLRSQNPLFCPFLVAVYMRSGVGIIDHDGERPLFRRHAVGRVVPTAPRSSERMMPL